MTTQRSRKTPTPARLDLYKQNADDYAGTAAPRLLSIAAAQYLAIEGQSAPDTAPFREAVGALYNVAFTIKMAAKFAGNDYVVCKLEALWWAHARADFLQVPREHWCYVLMIRTPNFIGSTELGHALHTLAGRGKSPVCQSVRLLQLEEGHCVQALHLGAYSEEDRTIANMHEVARAYGFEPHGKHHEIYLSDPRRVAPERLKTILRRPVRPRTTTTPSRPGGS